VQDGSPLCSDASAVGLSNPISLCVEGEVKIKQSRYRPGVAQRVPGS